LHKRAVPKKLLTAARELLHSEDNKQGNFPAASQARTRGQSMLITRRVVEITLWLLLAFPLTAWCAEKSAEMASLQINIAARQPADAPVIFDVELTNTTEHDMADNFEWTLPYSAVLTGPDGAARQVAVTNGAQTQGSFPSHPSLKPGKVARTPMRLTSSRRDNSTRCLPSEQVYLPPGEYQLDMTWNSPGHGQRPDSSAQATAKFQVIRDATLRTARFKELEDMREARPRFVRHVLEDTLTPEMRRQWYREIEHDDLQKASWKVYTLCRFVETSPDAPADVMPAIIEALKTFVHHPDPNSKEVNSLLNNAAYLMENRGPPGAGPALLTLATGEFFSSSRTPALSALRHYYRDEMAESLLPLLKEDDKWVPIYAARLLAWSGDDRGAEVLITAAGPDNPFAAASLAYLSNHTAAAQALEKLLASDDEQFVARLKRTIDQQLPPRKVASQK